MTQSIVTVPSQTNEVHAPAAKITGCLRRLHHKTWRRCHDLSALLLDTVSMHMLVMRIGHMRMAVPHFLVMMQVGMRANDRRVVGVVVVTVRMVMGVLMVHGLMNVFMAVDFGKVQCDTAQHQQTTQHHPSAG
jgi:hypothetical protein